MKSILSGCLLLPVACLLTAGCPINSLTTVNLVNEGNFAVDVTIYIHDDQLVPDALIDDLGTELNYVVAAGETVTFVRPCDDLQAIKIGDADLRVIAGIGPDANTRTYRDGSDFGCGDALTFTFTHNLLATTLNVEFSKSD